MIHRKIEGIWTSEIGDDFLSFQLFQVAAACELLPDVSGFFSPGYPALCQPLNTKGYVKHFFDVGSQYSKTNESFDSEEKPHDLNTLVPHW